MQIQAQKRQIFALVNTYLLLHLKPTDSPKITA